MSNQNTPETQYSIYKINYDAVEGVFKDISHGANDEEYAVNVINVLVNSVKAIVSKKYGSLFHKVKFKDFSGIVFKTIHYPTWNDVAKELLVNNECTDESKTIDDKFLTNTNVSYVYFYCYKEKVFAVTGGYGSNYITKFVEKNFGLYLLPKIIKKDNSVIKSIQQNNLLGNQTASQRTNKNATSIQCEQDMSSIFRQLSIEAPCEIAESLGIVFDEKESVKKKINIVNKDSIVIRRSISLEELKQLIQKIYDIENGTDNFALNYLVLARKKNLKNADLYEEMLKTLIDGKTNNFLLTGDDYTTFFTAANKYIIQDKENSEIILDREEPILFKDIVECLGNKKNGKGALNHMLKDWQISTVDNAGNYVLFPVSILEALQGFIEYGENNQPCYLFNGQWYVFDQKYNNILENEFDEIYDNQSEKREEYFKNFELNSDCLTEDGYNKDLRKKGTHLVTHTALMDYIEIADAIIFKDDTVFLMHNKEKFSGIGSRDVINQVLTSAAYLQQRLSSSERDSFLEEYYEKIKEVYISDNLSMPINIGDFKKHFQGSYKIHYLIGYLELYSKNSRSTYAKYLTVEVVKRLKQRGYDCTSLLIDKTEKTVKDNSK